MGILEIVGGVLLIVLCVIIIVAVTAQESKGGVGASIMGDSSGTFFDKNRGNTKEAMLVRATTVCGIAMAVIVLVVLFASLK